MSRHAGVRYLTRKPVIAEPLSSGGSKWKVSVYMVRAAATGGTGFSGTPAAVATVYEVGEKGPGPRAFTPRMRVR